MISQNIAALLPKPEKGIPRLHQSAAHFGLLRRAYELRVSDFKGSVPRSKSALAKNVKKLNRAGLLLAPYLDGNECSVPDVRKMQLRIAQSSRTEPADNLLMNLLCSVRDMDVLTALINARNTLVVDKKKFFRIAASVFIVGSTGAGRGKGEIGKKKNWEITETSGENTGFGYALIPPEMQDD